MYSIGDDLTLYLMLNCSTNQLFNFVGTSNMPLGTCDNPEAGGCHEMGAFNSYRRTNDEFGWVLSPQLDDEAIKRVEFICTAMKANVTH